MLFQRTVSPRLARQKQRNNVPAEKPKKYFERSLAIPLLDKFIAEPKFRFNDLNEKSNKPLFLVAAVSSKMENSDFAALSDFYRYDLPSKDVTDLEIKLWKRAWSLKPAN